MISLINITKTLKTNSYPMAKSNRNNQNQNQNQNENQNENQNQNETIDKVATQADEPATLEPPRKKQKKQKKENLRDLLFDSDEIVELPKRKKRQLDSNLIDSSSTEPKKGHQREN